MGHCGSFSRWACCIRAAQYASRAQLDYKGTVAVAPASNLGSILVDGEAQVANAPIDIKIGTYAA